MNTGLDKPRFWWCLTHERVETDDGCPNTVRLGPFDTREEAERAIDTAHKRTQDWESDPAWND